MQKIISLDIGSYSVKAIEILNHFKSYEISNFYETVIPQFDELDPNLVIPRCMAQVFSENNIEADRIITAMPGQYISSRVIPFNFSDPHKIASSVAAQVEDIVPFDMDDMIVDSQILGTVDGKTNVLVVMTKKTFLASFLEHLQRIEIDPKLIDVDSLSFYNLCPHLPMEPGKVYGLIDVGHEKTSVCLVQDGTLRMFRSINLGGRYLTEFLSRDFEVDFNEAQRMKHRVSQVKISGGSLDHLSQEDRLVAERLTMGASAVVKELGRTLYTFKSWEKSPLDKIYLSGGTSRIKNFSEFLSEHLEVETVPNQLDETDLRINPDLHDHIPSMAQGIAIGIRAVTSLKRHSKINLRKGEFAYVQDYESILRTGGLGFKIIAVALFLLCVAYVAKFFIYDQQIDGLQAKYKKEFVASFPEFKSKYRSSKIPFSRIKRDSISMLRDRIQAKEQSVADFVDVNGDSGALLSLKEISANLPPDVKVNVVEYKYASKPDGSGQISLRIETDSFDTIAKFQEALKTISVFDKIVERSSDPKPGTDLKVAVIETNYMGR